MAGSVNKVILIGNLGADPEIKRTQDGRPIANLRIATSETWRDRATGERKEKTEWHRVAFFGKLAEIAANGETAEQRNARIERQIAEQTEHLHQSLPRKTCLARFSGNIHFQEHRLLHTGVTGAPVDLLRQFDGINRMYQLKGADRVAHLVERQERERVSLGLDHRIAAELRVGDERDPLPVRGDLHVAKAPQGGEVVHLQAARVLGGTGDRQGEHVGIRSHGVPRV